MKKKHEKKYVINSSDWTKDKVSLLEANLTQQTIILFFFEKSDLSNYSICICPLSPLLGTPEKVTQELCDFSQAEILENEKLYIVFSNVESGPALDENNNLVISKISDFPIALKDNEVIGLLKKDVEDTWKLVDWVVPIVDEVIPIEILRQVPIVSKHEDTNKHEDANEPEENLKFMRKKETENTSPSDTSKTEFLYIAKPKLWLYSFLFVISFIEISSLISFVGNLWDTIYEIIVLIVKNILIGNATYDFIISDKKTSKKNIISFLIALVALILSLMLFLYNVITATVIIFIVVIIFSLLILKQRIK